MKDLVVNLAPVIGLQLATLLAAVFVFIHSQGRGAIRLAVVPLALAAVIACPFLLAPALGHAVAMPLPERFILLGYRPVLERGTKQGLELWIRTDADTRLHRIPYSEGMEEMLQNAQKGAHGGRRARIARKAHGPAGPKGSQTAQGEYELGFESPSDVPKEGGLPPQPNEKEAEPVTRRYSV